jgi:transcriptional regulator with XRE-family HTH domain
MRLLTSPLDALRGIFLLAARRAVCYLIAAMNSIRLLIEGLTKRSGLSQADIARLLGVSDKTLNAWLTGRVTCRHEQMLGLALEALSARIEKEGRKFKMGRSIKDATVIKTQKHRLTAETSGSGGRRFVAIYLDGQYADCLDEWLDSWYYKLNDNEPPTADHEKIGSTPEEALDWWLGKHGLAFAGA